MPSLRESITTAGNDSSPRSMLAPGRRLKPKDRRLGGSESARTEHPSLDVVSSRPCMRARSVTHVESTMK